jgi:putative oxidoreductase
MILLLVCRIIVGLLLLLFGVAKALQTQRAAVAQVNGYKILNVGTSRAAAALLPAVEICLGVLLIAGIAVGFAGALAAALFLGFAIVIGSAVRRGLSNDCGCAGALSTSRVRPALVYRNLGLAVLAVMTALLGPGSFALGPSLTAQTTAGIVGFLILALVAHGALRVRADRPVASHDNKEVAYVQHQP